MAQTENTTVVASVELAETQQKGPMLLDPQMLRFVSGGLPHPVWTGVVAETPGTTEAPHPTW